MPARLKVGTTLADYSSPARVMKAFGGDMKEIRAEYSRLRSILRKRLDRLEAAKEIHNAFYIQYRDRDAMLPSLKNLSDRDVLIAIQSVAHGIGVGYQFTVNEIRKSRESRIETLHAEAEKAGDKEFAELLDKTPTPRQLGQIGRMMNMIKKVIGPLDYSRSGDQKAYQYAMKVYLQNKDTSLLTLSAQVINDLGLVPKEVKKEEFDPLAMMKEQFTSTGTTRVSWAKAHGKRGK